MQGKVRLVAPTDRSRSAKKQLAKQGQQPKAGVAS
jgi:hypothetical protein